MVCLYAEGEGRWPLAVLLFIGTRSGCTLTLDTLSGTLSLVLPSPPPPSVLATAFFGTGEEGLLCLNKHVIIKLIKHTQHVWKR